MMDDIDHFGEPDIQDQIVELYKTMMTAPKGEGKNKLYLEFMTLLQKAKGGSKNGDIG